MKICRLLFQQARIIPIKVSAFEDYWSDVADTSGYVGHETDTEYTITTAEQLAGVYNLSHGMDSVDFAGKAISLGADIDLSGRNWCTIDTFKGVFDGKGHSISNKLPDLILSLHI